MNFSEWMIIIWINLIFWNCFVMLIFPKDLVLKTIPDFKFNLNFWNLNAVVAASLQTMISDWQSGMIILISLLTLNMFNNYKYNGDI